MPYGRKRRPTRYRPKTGYSSSRKTTSYPKRRTGYKRRSTYKKASRVRPKWLNPLSQKELVAFTYADTNFSVSLNPLAALPYIGYYVFRGNSGYDPDYTGVGVQPYGWDQYVGERLYTSYRIPSASIRVYFRPESDYANIRHLHCLVFPTRQNAITSTDIADYRMTPYVRETVYDGQNESTRGCKIKHYASTQKTLPEGSQDDIQYSGTYLVSPAYGWYWVVMFYTTDYDDETIDVYFDVKIKYYTVLGRGYQPNES